MNSPCWEAIGSKACVRSSTINLFFCICIVLKYLCGRLVDMARYRAQNGKMCFLCFMYFMCFFAAKPKKIWAGFDVFFQETWRGSFQTITDQCVLCVLCVFLEFVRQILCHACVLRVLCVFFQGTWQSNVAASRQSLTNVFCVFCVFFWNSYVRYYAVHVFYVFYVFFSRDMTEQCCSFQTITDPCVLCVLCVFLEFIRQILCHACVFTCFMCFFSRDMTE